MAERATAENSSGSSIVKQTMVAEVEKRVEIENIVNQN